MGGPLRAVVGLTGLLCAAGLLILFGHSLQSPPLMVATMLPLIFLSRTFQAHNYGLFVMQNTLCFVLLSESLAQDWHLAQVRLFNSLLGVTLALLVALVIYGMRQYLGRHQAVAVDSERR